MEHTSFERSESIRTRLVVALCVLAVLPAANLWLIETLNWQQHGERQRPPALATHRSGIDDPHKMRDGSLGPPAAASSERGMPSEVASRAREFGAVQSTVVAIAPVTSPLAASSSFWLVSETTLALLSTIILFSTALGLVGSAALAAGRMPSPQGSNRHAVAPVADASGVDRHEVSRDASRLAEQVRVDIGEMVHAMRSPIAVVVAYAERLKSVVSVGDLRAYRAVEAVGISGAQLNELLDGAWRKENELAALFLAERYPVDLAEILRNAVEEESESLDPARVVVGDARVSNVSAPPGVLERIVDECLSTMLSDRSCVRVVATVETARGLACLHLAAERDPSTAIPAADEMDVLEEMPLFVHAARTVTLLGGNLTVVPGEGGARSITMTLPAYET